MTRLEEALSTGGPATVCALHGMPGVGKSQLAAACAERCESRGWAFVGWVAAPTRQQAIAELAMIARIAGIAPDDGPLEDAASRLVSWLSEGIRADRLLVFDNVDNADDLEGLVPRGQGMRVIVTTTAQVAATWMPVEVGVLSTPQAVALLTHVTGVAGEVEAAALAGDLDRLPVALAQAASTIRLLRLGCAEYRTLLAGSPVDDTLQRREGASARVTVDRALRMAYRSYLSRLADSDPEQAAIARRVLGALSLVAESGTPTSWLHVLGGDPVAVQRAVEGLIRQSLLTPDADGRRVALHRLQARVIREDPEAGAEAHRAAVAVLGAAGAGSGGDYWAQRTLLCESVVALAEVLGQEQSRKLTGDPEVLVAAGRVIRQADLLRDPCMGLVLSPFVDVSTQALGADHPDTLTVADHLAGLHRSVGDLRRSIPLYEQTLAGRVRVLGPDHPDTLASRNDLAGAYRSAGDLGRAIALYEENLAAALRVWGADHPGTVSSRTGLAYAYHAAGDLGRAIPLYEEALADTLRLLGGDHPATLESSNNLAGAYRAVGDLGRAIPLYEQTLAGRVRALGADHPDSLASRNNLAAAFRSVGDLGRAIPLYEESLGALVRVRGAQHSDTLAARNNLAYAYASAGDLGRAIPLYEATLADAVRVLGADHPITEATRNNLAGASRSAGDSRFMGRP